MDALLFKLLFFIVALAILIAVHEFGHFWVARKLGVKVLRFSIGFGRPLWKRVGKVDGTEFVIAAIPLGGYVKMLDEREAPVEPEEQARAFNRQSLPVRSAIVVAGPLFNFLFAIFAFWLIFVTGDSGFKPLVGDVAEASRAEQIGFQPGDEILSVSGKPTPSWELVIYELLGRSLVEPTLTIHVRTKEGDERHYSLQTEGLQELAEEGQILKGLGLSPARLILPPVIDEILAGEPADRAGLQSGDRIISVDGEAVENWNQWVEYVRARPEQSLQMEVERASQILTLSLTPASRKEGDKTIGRVGAGPNVPEDLRESYRSVVRYGPVEAVGRSMAKTWDYSILMLRMLGKMIVGEVSVKNLSGPISIADYAGKSASHGMVYFLKFLAVVSISLGVLNLLPIPVLDGGHLFFFLIEAVKGSPLSEHFMEQGQKMGMLILLAIMGLAIFIDLNRYLG
ncbi:MAG: sigma E protease regulator RseP [Candidatus Thiodiazotropha sp. (ex Semelilucina semeliformis)]|nr:sigma E protease regulator RseP [Candidatus Thiodiazotropha sp. (ex Semelilucina semeliformis)]